MGARLGQKWGMIRTDLRIDTRYRISPSETKALKGYWGHMVPNTLWRLRSNIFYMLPPIIGTYMLIAHANAEHEDFQENNQENLMIKRCRYCIIYTWLEI